MPPWSFGERVRARGAGADVEGVSRVVRRTERPTARRRSCAPIHAARIELTTSNELLLLGTTDGPGAQ